MKEKKKRSEIKIEIVIHEINEADMSDEQRQAREWLAAKFSEWARDFTQNTAIKNKKE
jgi:hypothetical protein